MDSSLTGLYPAPRPPHRESRRIRRHPACHQPVAIAPATLQPPGGFPVATVHGALDGVDVAQRTPLRQAIPFQRHLGLGMQGACASGRRREGDGRGGLKARVKGARTRPLCCRHCRPHGTVCARRGAREKLWQGRRGRAHRHGWSAPVASREQRRLSEPGVA